MSYFILTFGEKIDLTNFSPAILVQPAEFQGYLKPIVQAISNDIKFPAYLVDDGETQTSSLIIDEAEDLFERTNELTNSILFKIIELLAAKGNAVIIWWANNDLLAYQSAHRCTSLEMLFEVATAQLKSNQPIQVFLPPTLKSSLDF